ncbi:disulfide bond formation protein DsbA [Actinopolymorpha sp. NPDC004070]|uniref:mycothiol-dependent nitroreductase Rv2466c family protein n=1 Tax=Actinopolymorpha sp. NPDC004070 TaxID=3154548 RepID=UPI0033BA7D11
METNTAPSTVTVYLDPTCPFAWITSRWLAEVELQAGLDVRRELMSLSVVNENRELDGWYRDYNDRAWRPARVAAALLASPHAEQWTDFYERFGQRRHVGGLRDDQQNTALTLDELSLPAGLAAAAEDPSWDADLRTRTKAATAPLADDGGTPILHIEGRGFFGPVLTAVPRGEAALRLWHAVWTLATTPSFSELKGARDERLQTD